MYLIYLLIIYSIFTNFSHVERSKHIENIVITNLSGTAQGTKRVTAVTGEQAFKVVPPS